MLKQKYDKGIQLKIFRALNPSLFCVDGRRGLAPPPPPPPPAPEPAYLDIQFISGFAPERFIDLLNHPGLQVQKMEWNIRAATWQYQLKWSYARPVARTATDANAKDATDKNAAPVRRRPGQPITPVTPATPAGGQKP